MSLPDRKKQVKRLKEDRTLVFRKKGNKKQFLFNDNMKDQIKAAGKQLDLLEPPVPGQKKSLEKAKKELQKGLVLLAGRQKRIKMADRSEFGWAAVDEYKDDELASDEDDAKKMEKAERSVASKAVSIRKQSNFATPQLVDSTDSHELQNRPLPVIQRLTAI